ncbi:DMT family transporter [Ruania zhangjianzhongii]|uniref:DMT family transporter n=1 Tax=Ruania zhangjianzhongii TaxID=2603206 RepID=UPI0011C9FEC6|nr:DMT family transporter [Ruania zhangjianzhongii]
MTATALTLVLCAALFHALWNSAAKGASGDSYVFVWVNSVGSAVLCLPLALVQLAQAGWPWSWELLVAAVGSALLHIVYSLVLQTGYQRAELGVVYPVARGVGPLLTMLVALLVLGERPGVAAVLGGVVVLAGILVVTTGNSVARRDRLVRGLVYGSATGVAIAGYTLWDNHAVVAWELAPLTYFAFTITIQSLLLTPGALLRRRHWQGTVRANWHRSAVVAVLSPLAYILVLIAMQTTPVSVVAPVRESSIVIGSLLAWWLYQEPNPVRRLIGAVVVLAGIALIAAG